MQDDLCVLVFIFVILLSFYYILVGFRVCPILFDLVFISRDFVWFRWLFCYIACEFARYLLFRLIYFACFSVGAIWW